MPAGQGASLDALIIGAYEQLRRCAAARSAGRNTSVVHELYLRLRRSDRERWQDRSEFIRYASTVLRNLLVDRARAQSAQKRGGEVQFETIDESLSAEWQDPARLLDLNRALDRLAGFSPRTAKIVELRFIAGVSQDEIAAVLDMKPRDVRREWEAARLWLYKELAIQE